MGALLESQTVVDIPGRMEEESESVTPAFADCVARMPHAPGMSQGVSGQGPHCALQFVDPRATALVLARVIEGHSDRHETEVLMHRGAHWSG